MRGGKARSARINHSREGVGELNMNHIFISSLVSASILVGAISACTSKGEASAPSEGNADSGAAATSTFGGVASSTNGGVSSTVGAVNAATTGGTGTSGGLGSGGSGGNPSQVDLGASGAGGDSAVDPVESFGTNPFVVAQHDPLSTFAADVDTASYDTFRSLASSGYLPETDRVRLEEFVNYFDYSYPAPSHDAEQPFGIALEAAPSPFASGTTLLRVGIQGKEAPPLERKPTNLVFLVDVSGSMNEELPLVQQVLTETVDLLNEQDTISIVTYAGSTSVRLTPTPTAERDTIVDAIDGLSSGGSTAGAAGLDLAYQQAEAGFLEEGLNHIILCTDGDFNVGPSSTSELIDVISEKRRSGVTLTVLGFGANNNDDLMEGISNAGNGVYANITDSTQASRYVEERMLATLEHIAKDVKLQVEFNPSQVYAYRLLGYENRAIADDDFRDDAVDAGEIASGHRVTALYEVVPNDGTVPSALDAPETDDGAPYAGPVEVPETAWVLVKVRYKDPGASESDAAKEVALSLDSEELASAISAADADFRWAVGVAAVAELLKASPYAPADHLDTIAELIQSDEYASDPDKQEFVQLFANVKGQLPRAP